MTQEEAGITPLPLPITEAALYRPRVEITFEYTFGELREGLTQSAEQQQQLRGQAKAKRTALLLGWVLFIALAVFFFMLLNERGSAASRRLTGLSPPTVDIRMAVGPSLVAALLVAGLVVSVSLGTRLMMDNRQKVRDTGKRLPTMVALPVMMICFVAAFLLWFQQPSGWTVSYRLGMTLALLPWIVVIALAFASVIWLNRASLRVYFEARPYLRRRRTIVLDDDGERSTDGVTDLFYSWPHFHQAWETANVLVLLDENEFRHILPKRVMDQAMLEQARAIIGNHIADARFLTKPGGFPVASPVLTAG